MSGYYPMTAQDQALARWRRLAKLARHEDLLAHVVDRLRGLVAAADRRAVPGGHRG